MRKIGKKISIIFLTVFICTGFISIILDLILNSGNRVIFSMVLDLFNSASVILGIITGGVAVSGAIEKYKGDKKYE